MLDLPHVELDGLFHGPGWRRRASFDSGVTGASAGPGWVPEWQYSSVRPLLLERADLLMRLDLPMPLVLGLVVRRTVGRRLRREVLWNGNREPPLHTLLTDREHIVRSTWRTPEQTAPGVALALALRPGLPVVRLPDRGSVER